MYISPTYIFMPSGKDGGSQQAPPQKEDVSAGNHRRSHLEEALSKYQGENLLDKAWYRLAQHAIKQTWFDWF